MKHTLTSCRAASDRYWFIAGESLSEYFGDAGPSPTTLRELLATSMPSVGFLCCIITLRKSQKHSYQETQAAITAEYHSTRLENSKLTAVNDIVYTSLFKSMKCKIHSKPSRLKLNFLNNFKPIKFYSISFYHK